MRFEIIWIEALNEGRVYFALGVIDPERTPIEHTQRGPEFCLAEAILLTENGFERKTVGMCRGIGCG